MEVKGKGRVKKEMNRANRREHHDKEEADHTEMVVADVVVVVVSLRIVLLLRVSFVQRCHSVGTSPNMRHAAECSSDPTNRLSIALSRHSPVEAEAAAMAMSEFHHSSRTWGGVGRGEKSNRLKG